MRRIIGIVLTALGPAVWCSGSAAQDKTEPRKLCCSRMWYTSESCTCKPNPKSAECPCSKCTGGEKCPCLEALRKGTGTLTGTVAHKSVAKFSTVVYVEEMEGQKFEAPAEPQRLDQKNKAFLPQVTPILVGTTVEFLNSDSFEHNVNSPDNEKFDLGNWGGGEKKSYTFKHAGVYTLLCKVHPEMIGYAVVTKTPYFAVANEKGEFRIANVPAGKWKVKVWNERLKPKQLEATFEAAVEEGKECRIEIKP